jgi:hypothetical protein
VGLGWWRGLPRSRFWRAVSTALQKPAATRSRSSRSFSPAGFGRGLEPRAEHSSGTAGCQPCGPRLSGT